MYKQELILLTYNKDVICVFDKDSPVPKCTQVEKPKNENSQDVKNEQVPSHDPYIPRLKAILYNCTSITCEPLELTSITQVTSPTLKLRSCFPVTPERYECEDVRYNYYKNVDKLLFLANYIPSKAFYLVDCLVYARGARVCHSKYTENAHAELLDTAKIAKPEEEAVLSQDEFICEESPAGEVVCDLNPFVPFENGLNVKQIPKLVENILLKTNTFLVIVKLTCDLGSLWCGYVGKITQSRRAGAYKPPGGDVYRCFYAKKQQVCSRLYSSYQTNLDYSNV